MPSMERSVSMMERGTAYGPAADLRSYSASYAPRLPPPTKVMSRAKSTAGATAWSSRQAPQHAAAVQRSGSFKPGVNLRSYSASYGPTLAGAGGEGQLKRSGSVTSWSASGRRSVNLRGYTPSFAALDDTAAAAVRPPAAKKPQAGIEDAAELRRRKRLVVYKVYDVEGKLRSSVRRGVGWIKSRCSRVMYGLW
ncbi:hypothetical protein QOZ80_2AG0106680 [Eleusine coracana subsp. coracana]|nr:hypothetical protein QOZ80_2AG0106680 [Eleusine coracana subsp. coracana]